MGRERETMMNVSEVRIVTDSSADTLRLETIATASAPLKITTADAEYVDTPELDVSAMTHALATYKGKSSTTCPSMGHFLDAFGDAKYVFCITITARLSGTYNVALSAAREYEELHPDRRVFVIDSRNTGPGMRLLAEKIEELVLAGNTFDEVCDAVSAYSHHTELLFLLESLNNLANNGRVSRAVAKLAGLLGIRMLGQAVEGQIEPVAKPRGEGRSLQVMLEKMLSLGFRGGKLRISHCENERAAHIFADLVRKVFPSTDLAVYPAGGLCSFYAERGGLLVGFET